MERNNGNTALDTGPKATEQPEQGKSQREIAEATGTSQPGVKKIIDSDNKRNASESYQAGGNTALDAGPDIEELERKPAGYGCGEVGEHGSRWFSQRRSSCKFAA